MAGRSLQASAEGIQIIRKAIKRDGWKQEELKAELGLKTRQPITRLLRGEAIERATFEELCHLLGLRVEDVAVPEAEGESPVGDIDALVRQVREAIRPVIQERCGTMRVLDMSQPIALGTIYTHVNILEKITGRTGRELAELRQEISTSLEDFDRFSLGRVRGKPIPGLEAVEQHSKLMILGKPGAGKTTFLKHLAIQCLGEAFQTHRVPLFITLKDFAEADGQPDLFTYLSQVIPDDTLQPILQAGRALILLDGLDEVRETDADRVLRQIRQFAELYSGNAFVITCRIAAREYTFQQFTEVEVADFDDAQIADVSSKWFQCRQDDKKVKRFLEKLKQNPPIRELASSPLLLTLLCLVFEDSGDFPLNRSELYESGVDVLLKKWDSKRNIEREQVYKQLSLKRKEDLLSQIGWRTFETGNYFVKQKELERQIREFIEHLPGASDDEATLNLDSEAVLKSIEAQHGLFVERARGIYSFSHLTVHEYFAAREAKEKSYLPDLAQHLTEKRWREVILLTVGMLPNADALLNQMKQQVDHLLAGDEKLQQFLTWVEEKARSVDAPYKPAAIRAFYFGIARALACALARALACALARARDRALAQAQALDLTLARALAQALELELDFDLALDLACDLDRALDPELQRQLRQIKDQLPDTSWENWENFQQWWWANGAAWTAEFRAILIEHRNIGHDWQFSEAQKQKLQQYYDANQLLVDCLNSDCYVSRPVRQEIEDTLLLPLAEIETRRNP
jgi:predicted NACHT family NTPase